MSETAKITSKNQITLPAKVRKSLGVRAGDKIDFIRNAAGHFEFRARTEVLADLIGALKAEASVCNDDIEAWIKDAREAMATDSSHAGD
jgi:AbrB family looped-hinge helix DNA binding protein